jgi:hypothetical protein
MGILYAAQLGLFFLTWLFVQVKTVQLLPVAISRKPAMGAGWSGVRLGNFQNFAAKTANEGNL